MAVPSVNFSNPQLKAEFQKRLADKGYAGFGNLGGKNADITLDDFRAAFQVRQGSGSVESAYQKIFVEPAALASSNGGGPNDHQIDSQAELNLAVERFTTLIALPAMTEATKALKEAKKKISNSGSFTEVDGFSPPDFVMWRYVNAHDVWRARSSKDIFQFQAGAVVHGTLACVESVAFNAGDYQKFISRVTTSYWMGDTPPPAGVQNKSSKAFGVVAGRHGLQDRVSVMKMKEQVGPSGEVIVDFDTCDELSERDLNQDRPSKYKTGSYTTADTKGRWKLTPYGAGPDATVEILYTSNLDINTWLPNVIVEMTIDETGEIFQAILAKINQRCGTH